METQKEVHNISYGYGRDERGRIMKREITITKIKGEYDEYLLTFSLFGMDLFAKICVDDGKLAGSSFIQEKGD